MLSVKAVTIFVSLVLAGSGQIVFAAVSASDATDSRNSRSAQDRVWPDNESPDLVDSEKSGGQQNINPIVEAALSYVTFTEVPYVWGGNSLGNLTECQACSECIIKNKIKGIKKRHQKCSACSKCGFDCSHFVQTVFDSADYQFPFMSTKSLLRASKKNPDLIPGLRFISGNLQDAQPGDLLVQKKHVVILIQMKSESVGDIVHMSRTVRKGRIGGIELRRNADLRTFFGGVKKIFRHEKMLNGPGQTRPSPGDIDMAMAGYQRLLTATDLND